MKKVLILHGWHGSDTPHWQAWLAQELVLADCIVAFPQLSNNTEPQCEEWIAEAVSIIDDFRPDIVICHSLANILWFHVCDVLERSVEKLLLCAPPRDHSDTPEVTTFFPSPIPSDLHADEVLMVVSDNDPYMSLDESIMLAMKLQVDLKVIKNGGHLNTSAGYGPWPWVKEWVLQ